MVNHLRENNLGYWEHWWNMKISGTIYTFLPDVLEIRSKELRDD